MSNYRMDLELREDLKNRYYQDNAIESGLFLTKTEPHVKHLFEAPCGSGKSIMELQLLRAIPDSILVTPRLEIVAGMLEKGGVFVQDMNEQELANCASNYGIFTPVRLRNWLRDGKLPWVPDALILDECHHSTADSWEDNEMYLNGIPTVGFTGTPYRGTPKGTEKFLDKWNNTINTVITLRETVEQGYNCMPTCAMWPLVDDDVIDVSNGEINITQADKLITDRMEALVSRCAQFYSSRMKSYDRPTMVALPSTNSVNEFVNVATRFGIPVAAVTQATSRSRRTRIFKQTLDCEVLLVQIDVISEGVDLPIRRLIDLKPTMSPVRWMQQVGRIMRPIEDGEFPPEYICCCRNLERHCYLMKGLIPNTTIVESQQAFKIPTRRAGMRAIGLEGLGRFKTTPVTTLDGVTMSTYNIYSFDGFDRTEFFAVVHPAHSEPIIGMRKIPIRDGKADWRASRWVAVDKIPDVKGCVTVREYPPTEKQQKRWNSDAVRVGLNPHEQLNSRNLQTLFFFQALGVRI